MLLAHWWKKKDKKNTNKHKIEGRTKNISEAKIVSLCPWSIICLAIPSFLVTNSVNSSHDIVEEKTTE